MVEIHSPQRKEPLFSQADTSQAQLEWEQNASLLEDAAALLDRYSPPKKGALSFLQGRPVISSQQYEAAAREVPARLSLARELLSLGKRITDGRLSCCGCKPAGKPLPWLRLDVPLGPKHGTHPGFYWDFPPRAGRSRLKNALARALPEVSGVEAEVLSQQPQQTCAFVLCHRSQASQVGDALRALGFSSPAAAGELPPAQQAEALKQELQREEQELRDVKGQLAAQAGTRESLLLAADSCGAKRRASGAGGAVAEPPHLLPDGVPAGRGRSPAAGGALSEIHPLCPGCGASPEEDPPVKLKNGLFTEPMEGVVEGTACQESTRWTPAA